MTDARPPLEAAAEAAIELAARRPWPEVSLRDIVQASGFPMAAFYGVARSKDDVVDAITRRFDKAAANDLEIDRSASARERVFDAAMARYDAMERHRAGLVSIIRAEISNPLGVAQMIPRALRTARWLLELAGVDTSGAVGAARVHGFALVLARTTRAWLSDDAGDLSRTMAALDRALRDVETWRERFTPPSRRGRSANAEPQSSAGQSEHGTS
jgi:AcrR family transcriptional regulator